MAILSRKEQWNSSPPPNQFCDIENLGNSSQNLAKLVEFTTEKTQIPNFLGKKKTKNCEKNHWRNILR
jgi:hypothetical protein